MSLNYKILLFTAAGLLVGFGAGYQVGAGPSLPKKTQEYRNLESEFKKLSARYEEIQEHSKRLAKAYSERAADNPKPAKTVELTKQVNNPAHVGYREVAKDGNLAAYDNGIVYDSRTGLEWFLGPDKDIDWYQARAWVKSISDSKGKWRMPTVDELQNLYKKGTGTRNISPLFKNKGWYVWSGKEKNASSAWGFGFYIGSDFIDLRDASLSSRVFAVRSRKKWWNVF